jgi:hypothetical protein
MRSEVRRLPQNNDLKLFAPMPAKGIGARALGCDKYDECLYKAAVEDWPSFNCEGCLYKGRGVVEFIEPLCVPEIEEDEIFIDTTEVELLDLVFHSPFLTTIKENLAYND